VKKALSIVVALGVSLVAGSGISNAGEAASAKTYRLSASMTPGQVVTIRNRPWRFPTSWAKARGSLTATLDTKRRTLTWRIQYSGLRNTPLVIADVHIGKPGRFGPILVRLCAECKSGQRGVKKLKADDPAKFLATNTWLTLITGPYPNGVVRGQIKVL
jgi:CHRD domain